MVIVTAIVLLGPPLLLTALELAARPLGRGWEERLHHAFLGLLCATLAVYTLRRIGLPGLAAVGLGVVLGAAALAAYLRAAAARSLAAALSPAVPLFGAWFLLVSPVSGVVLSPDGDYEVERASSRVPVILVVLDELPTVSLLDAGGRLDARRWPGFAQLARGSTWYREATTVHAETRWAVPAIFSGRHSPSDSIAVPADHPRSVFTLMGQSHRLEVSEPYTSVCPQDLCPREDRRSRLSRVREVLRTLGILGAQRVLPRFLSSRLPPLAQFRQVDAGEQVEDFLEGLEAAPGGRPPLGVLHLLQPHGPWERSMHGEEYSASLPSGLSSSNFEIADEPWWARQLRQRHLAQLRYTDGLLARLMRGLRRSGLWDRAAVAVVADHGVSTLPGERLRDPTPANAHDILPVPLFVKAPGQRRGRVSRAPATTLDVLPTLARMAGVRPSWRFEGRPLDELRPGDRRRASADGVRVSGISVPLSELRRGVLRAARANARVFGEGDPRRILRVGPRPDLIGRRVDVQSLRPAGAGLSAKLDGGQGTVRVSGRVAGVREGRALPLALIADGRVLATTLTYTRGPAGAFTALLPRAARRLDMALIEGARLLALGPGSP